LLMKILVVHPAPAHTHQITSRHTCSTLVIYRSIKQRELSHCERRGQPRGNERHGRQWTYRSPSPSCSAMSASSSSSAGNDDDDDDVDDDAACCAGLDAAAAIISASSSGDGKPASAAAAGGGGARPRGPPGGSLRAPAFHRLGFVSCDLRLYLAGQVGRSGL
jgi:hypothetical protein